jgi:hypothetical protein
MRPLPPKPPLVSLILHRPRLARAVAAARLRRRAVTAASDLERMRTGNPAGVVVGPLGTYRAPSPHLPRLTASRSRSASAVSWAGAGPGWEHQFAETEAAADGTENPDPPSLPRGRLFHICPPRPFARTSSATAMPVWRATGPLVGEYDRKAPPRRQPCFFICPESSR